MSLKKVSRSLTTLWMLYKCKINSGTFKTGRRFSILCVIQSAP